MKRIIFCAIAALALAGCETTPEETIAPAPTTVTSESEKVDMECAVENPDGTCACEVMDQNGDCVEGGGTGVIVGGGVGSVVNTPARAEERTEDNSVIGGGSGTIGQGGVPE